MGTRVIIMQTDEYIPFVFKTESRKDIEARYVKVAAPGSSKINAGRGKGQIAEMVFRLSGELLDAEKRSLRLSQTRSAISDPTFLRSMAVSKTERSEHSTPVAFLLFANI